MPIPLAFVIRFLQLVTKRQFAEAERELERIKASVHKTEWNEGYLNALHGILSAQKSSDDQYIFLSGLDFDNKDELQSHRREFLKHVRDSFHADYDRGFFSAWAEYMRVLIKLQVDAQTKAVQTKLG